MAPYKKNKSCMECNIRIDSAVFSYSINKSGAPLCIPHQKWLKKLRCSAESKALYFALKEKGISAELEKHDGYKKVDITVEDAQVHIEVDGKHHNSKPNQALADLKRTYYSLREGYITLRIPNSLVQSYLKVTTQLIIDFLDESKGLKYRTRRIA